MPKKTPKNAFYFFMINFKEEQKQKGINYANMTEVSAAADPHWRNAPPSVRSKYEAIAKKEKQKFNKSEQKYTTTGISYAEIDRQQKELNDAKEHERKDINNLVKLRTFNNTVNTLNIYIMDVNCYCKAGTDYLIGEASLVYFNILEGVKEAYHEIINPGSIPIGYASDVKYGSKQLGLEMPDDTVKPSNYMQILATIIDYLKHQDPKAKVLPPIFTMPDKVAPVQNFIQQMCRRAGEDDSLFRIYQLDILFYTMINAIKTNSDEGFPKESLAILQLKKDPFQYTPGIGCEYQERSDLPKQLCDTYDTYGADMWTPALNVIHHEEIDLTVECTLSRVTRWAYTILDSCCPIAGVTAVAGKHVPPDFDMKSIELYQEQKRERLPPSIAGFGRGSVCSVLNSSATSATLDGEKRVQIPLRMPHADWQRNQHKVLADSKEFNTAPALKEDTFPPVLRLGKGRGSFSRLSLDE